MTLFKQCSEKQLSERGAYLSEMWRYEEHLRKKQLLAEGHLHIEHHPTRLFYDDWCLAATEGKELTRVLSAVCGVIYVIRRSM